jgi:hypothetical protein
MYRIVVQGRLDESWSARFDDMALTVERSEDGSAVTTLSGTVSDQPALHGLLARIRDLGLPLLSVERLCAQPGEHDGHETDPNSMAVKGRATEDPPALRERCAGDA